MKILLLLLSLLLLPACSTFDTDTLSADGAKASAFCTRGNGPPLTGGGAIAGGKVDQDFTGSISISPDCGITIESF